MALEKNGADRSLLGFVLGSIGLGAMLVLSIWVLFGQKPLDEFSEAVDERPVVKLAKPSSALDSSVRMQRHAEPIDYPKPKRPIEKSLETSSPRDSQLKTIGEWIENGQWQKAESLLIEMLEDNPKDELALMELAAIQLFDKSDPAAARMFLEDAIKLNPDSSEAINEALIVYQELNDLEGGLAFFESLRDQQRSSSALEAGIAHILLESGRADEAVSYYEEAMRQPDADESHLKERTATALIEAGRYEDGSYMFESLIASEDDLARKKFLQLRLASAHLDRNNPSEALRVLYEAKEQNPDDELISEIISDIQSQRF